MHPLPDDSKHAQSRSDVILYYERTLLGAGRDVPT